MMFKKALTAGAAAIVALPLAACDPTQLISQVQADAKLACNFVPDPSMITAVLSALGSVGAGVGIADTVASFICKGISVLPAPQVRASARRGGVVGAPAIVVNGQRVLVQGHFVR